jgi:hypothetical protein
MRALEFEYIINALIIMQTFFRKIFNTKIDSFK